MRKTGKLGLEKAWAPSSITFWASQPCPSPLRHLYLHQRQHGHDHLAILLDQQNEYLKMFDGPIHCGTGLGDAFKHLKKMWRKTAGTLSTLKSAFTLLLQIKLNPIKVLFNISFKISNPVHQEISFQLTILQMQNIPQTCPGVLTCLAQCVHMAT